MNEEMKVFQAAVAGLDEEEIAQDALGMGDIDKKLFFLRTAGVKVKPGVDLLDQFFDHIKAVNVPTFGEQVTNAIMADMAIKNKDFYLTAFWLANTKVSRWDIVRFSIKNALGYYRSVTIESTTKRALPEPDADVNMEDDYPSAHTVEDETPYPFEKCATCEHREECGVLSILDQPEETEVA